VLTDAADRRSRTLLLTRDGEELLAQAMPVWESTHREVEGMIPGGEPEGLRRSLRALS